MSKGWNERLSDEAVGNGLQDIEPLLAAGGNVTAISGKHTRAAEGSETAGNLLPHFLHANIALASIVGKRHVRIEQKGQHTEVVVLQTIEEIGRFALLPTSLEAVMVAAALGQNGSIAAPRLF